MSTVRKNPAELLSRMETIQKRLLRHRKHLYREYAAIYAVCVEATAGPQTWRQVAQHMKQNGFKLRKRNTPTHEILKYICQPHKDEQKLLSKHASALEFLRLRGTPVEGVYETLEREGITELYDRAVAEKAGKTDQLSQRSSRKKSDSNSLRPANRDGLSFCSTMPGAHIRFPAPSCLPTSGGRCWN